MGAVLATGDVVPFGVAAFGVVAFGVMPFGVELAPGSLRAPARPVDRNRRGAAATRTAAFSAAVFSVAANGEGPDCRTPSPPHRAAIHIMGLCDRRSSEPAFAAFAPSPPLRPTPAEASPGESTFLPTPGYPQSPSLDSRCHPVRPLEPPATPSTLFPGPWRNTTGPWGHPCQDAAAADAFPAGPTSSTNPSNAIHIHIHIHIRHSSPTPFDPHSPLLLNAPVSTIIHISVSAGLQVPSPSIIGA